MHSYLGLPILGTSYEDYVEAMKPLGNFIIMSYQISFFTYLLSSYSMLECILYFIYYINLKKLNIISLNKKHLDRTNHKKKTKE